MKIKGLNWLLAAALLALTACADPAGPPAGYGAVTAQAVWPGDPGFGANQAGFVPQNAPLGVTVMRAIINGPGMSNVVQSFPATPLQPGAGTVINVPAGVDRMLTLQGRTGGGVLLYEGTAGPIAVIEGEASDAGAVTMSPQDSGGNFTDQFYMDYAASPVVYSEAGGSEAPTTFDPLITATHWPFLVGLPIAARTSISVANGWDPAANSGDGAYNRELGIGLDIDAGQTGTFSVANAAVRFTDVGLPDIYYGGTVDGVAYNTNASGSITIDMFSTNRLLGSYNLTLENESAPAVTIVLSGMFDIKRDCDFFLPFAPPSSICPGGTAIAGIPVLTGAPTVSQILVLDEETIDVTVPMTVSSGTMQVRFIDANGQMYGRGTANISAPASEVVVPLSELEPGAPPVSTPEGTYGIQIQWIGSLGGGAYNTVWFGGDVAGGGDYGMMQFNVPDNMDPSTWSTYAAATAFALPIVDKAAAGYAAMVGVPSFEDLVAAPLSTLNKGESVVVRATVTGLATDARINLHQERGGSSTTRFGTIQVNPSPGTEWELTQTFPFGDDDYAGAWTAQMQLTNGSGDETWYSVPFAGNTYSAALRPGGSFVVGVDSGKTIPEFTVVGGPAVVDEFPNLAQAASPPPTITATFDQDIDTNTLSTSTFKVEEGSLGGTPVSGNVSYDQPTFTASFTPSGNLTASSTYFITIVSGASGVKTTGGLERTSDYIWSFNTLP